MADLLNQLLRLQHVEISWLDTAHEISWEKKQRHLLLPLKGVGSLRTCKIRYVEIRDKTEGLKGFASREDFLGKVKAAIFLPHVDFRS